MRGTSRSHARATRTCGLGVTLPTSTQPNPRSNNPKHSWSDECYGEQSMTHHRSPRRSCRIRLQVRQGLTASLPTAWQNDHVNPPPSRAHTESAHLRLQSLIVSPRVLRRPTATENLHGNLMRGFCVECVPQYRRQKISMNSRTRIEVVHGEQATCDKHDRRCRRSPEIC